MLRKFEDKNKIYVWTFHDEYIEFKGSSSTTFKMYYSEIKSLVYKISLFEKFIINVDENVEKILKKNNIIGMLNLKRKEDVLEIIKICESKGIEMIKYC